MIMIIKNIEAVYVFLLLSISLSALIFLFNWPKWRNYVIKRGFLLKMKNPNGVSS